MRTVIDTGVIVSALLVSRSTPRRAFDAAARLGRLLISHETVTELDQVLRRPRFERYVPERQRLEFLGALIRQAEAVAVTDVVTACRDPKDNKFLALAVTGKATHIVTGDADLLVMHPFRGVAVINPASFLALADPRGLGD